MMDFLYRLRTHFTVYEHMQDIRSKLSNHDLQAEMPTPLGSFPLDASAPFFSSRRARSSRPSLAGSKYAKSE